MDHKASGRALDAFDLLNAIGDASTEFVQIIGLEEGDDVEWAGYRIYGDDLRIGQVQLLDTAGDVVGATDRGID
jgi:hypothetical protein